MKGIIQNSKGCYFCGATQVEEHHIFGGSGRRKLSEKYGLKVWLCPEHHRGNNGAHLNWAIDYVLKCAGQRAFQEKYPELDFIKIFGRNYL